MISISIRLGIIICYKRGLDSVLNSVIVILVVVVVFFLIFVFFFEVIKFIYVKIYFIDWIGKNKYFYYYKIILYVINFM